MADVPPASALSAEPPVARLARPVVWLSLAIAVAVYVAMPILAHRWATGIPFLGVTLEQTFNVNDGHGTGWGPSPEGLDRQDHIVSIDGRAIDSQSALDQALVDAGVGRTVQVTYQRRLPDGGLQTRETAVRLMAFPLVDLIRLLWLPLLIGVTYLAIGLWVFRLRGRQRPGIAFTLFSIWVAVTLGVFFDVYSTHILMPLWPLGLGMAGAAALHLALVFPQEPRLVMRQPGLRMIPYAPAAVLIGYALVVLYDLADPWA